MNEIFKQRLVVRESLGRWVDIDTEDGYTVARAVMPDIAERLVSCWNAIREEQDQ